MNQSVTIIWKWLGRIGQIGVIPLTLAGLVFSGQLELITTVDEEQPRLNQAAPVPQSERTVAQTFIAQHNGLSAIELLAVVYPEPPGVSALTLRLTEADGHIVAEQTVTEVAHNAPLRITFTPIADSAGQTFTLTLLGSAQNNTTVWAYRLDGYPHGALAEAGGDLRFSTTYTYLPADIARDVMVTLLDLARGAGWLWLVLFAPGVLLLAALRVSFITAWSRWAVALAASVSLLALVWLWASVVGWQLNGMVLLIGYGAVGIITVLWTLREWTRVPTARPRLSAHDYGVFTLLLASTVVRFLAARDLAFPMWVDSPHHALIARVLAAAGHVPANYQPMLPVDDFTYHFGFHALAVTFHWLTGLSIPDTFLLIGNLLNGLMALAVYSLTAEITGRPRAGLVAMGVVGFVTLFPGYYLAWGRYTQLLGLIVLAPLLALTWQMVKPQPSPASLFRGDAPTLALIAVLVSGLLCIHYRVGFFFVTFGLAALAAGRSGGWRYLLIAAAGTLALTAPWLWQLSATWLPHVIGAPSFVTAPPGYNDFPFNYFDGVLERSWIVAAGLALLLKLVQRRRAAWMLAGWLALTSAVLNLGPGSWVVNNNSWAISLFLPGAVLIGWGGETVWEATTRLLAAPDSARRSLGVFGRMITMAACIAALALGARAQVTLANPTTLLALAADMPALEWVRSHTSPDSVFAANSWQWQGETWAGSDGGAWLTPLAQRSSTIPPVDYAYDGALFRRINTFNQKLAALTEANAPETLALFREAGVTHIFIGARGGVLKPEMFVDSPHYRLLFTNGGAWVFEVLGPVGVTERTPDLK